MRTECACESRLRGLERDARELQHCTAEETPSCGALLLQEETGYFITTLSMGFICASMIQSYRKSLAELNLKLPKGFAYIFTGNFYMVKSTYAITVCVLTKPTKKDRHCYNTFWTFQQSVIICGDQVNEYCLFFSPSAMKNLEQRVFIVESLLLSTN